MKIALGLSFLEFVLALSSLAAIGSQKHTVQHLAWTIGESDSQKFYIGLDTQVIEAEGYGTVTMKFADEDCGSDYCDLCHKQSRITVSILIFCLLLSFPPIFINYKRSSRTRDQNVQKVWGMAIACVSCVFCMIALTSFLEGCYYHLPRADEFHSEIDWFLGPGSFCLLFSIFLKPFDVILHMVLPVVKEEPMLEDIQEYSFQL